MASAAELPLAEAGRLGVRARSWLWIGAAAVFLLAAVLTGMLVGPVDLGVGTIARAVLSHVPLLGVRSHLSAADSAIL